jgi:hypothetical protein
LILLFSYKNGRLGFNLTALNLLAYAGFMIADAVAGNATPIDRADWLMIGLWAIFFGAVLFSARLIPTGRRRLGEPAAQPSIETIRFRS